MAKRTMHILAESIVDDALYQVASDSTGRCHLLVEGLDVAPVRRDLRSLPPYVVGGVEATERVRRALATSARKRRLAAA